ncbi:ty3-gypsy retrotransposon protein [Tanacetum coccineum]
MTSPNKPISKPSRVAKMSVRPIWRKKLNPCNTSNGLHVNLPTPMPKPLTPHQPSQENNHPNQALPNPYIKNTPTSQQVVSHPLLPISPINSHKTHTQVPPQRTDEKGKADNNFTTKGALWGHVDWLELVLKKNTIFSKLGFEFSGLDLIETLSEGFDYTRIPTRSYQLVLSLRVLVEGFRSKDKKMLLFIDPIHRYCSSTLFTSTVHRHFRETEQAATSQSEFEALQSELQTACRLLQTRHGGGGDQGALLPRSMRLDVPKFSGINLESWIFAINEYFSLLNTPAEQHLRIVGFNLEGAAAEWFRWMSRNGLITTWDMFEESVKNRFGPSKYEERKGRCRNCCNLRELLVSRPATLGDAFALAQITEARLEDQTAPATEDDREVAAAEEEDDVVESGDISILNSLIGHGSPRSLQLWGKFARGLFMYSLIMWRDVLCETVCSNVTVHIQVVTIMVDLYVLPMQGHDVVLGIQWLWNLGKVTHDYAQQIMEFTLLNKTYSLKGDDSFHMKKISFHQMQALLGQDEIYGVYEAHSLSKEAVATETQAEDVIVEHP